MQANLCCRWLLVGFLVVSPCFLTTDARGGRGGGGSRGSSGSRGGSRYSSRPSPSYSRPSPSYSRPSPSYSRPSPSYSRPSPSYSRPAPAPAPRPAPPAIRPPSVPAPRPAPSFSQTAPKPSLPDAPRQPAYNPNFDGSRPAGSPPAYNFAHVKLDGSRPAPPDVSRQPAYNPNFKLDGSRPAGPPPPYSPSGHPVPSAPVGLPPSFQSSNQLKPPPHPQQPPPYPGQPGRPPAYPGLSSSPANHPYPSQPELNRPYVVSPGINQPNMPKPYPVQPGYPGAQQPNMPKPYPVQPGYPGAQQPNMPKPYPVQPGYPGAQQPNMPKPYPVQPGYPGAQQPNVPKPYPVQPGYPGAQQSNMPKPYPVQPGYSGAQQQNPHRPYPVQPGVHNPYPGVNRPYPQQSLGGNVWQPHYGKPPPAYMNYGGIPTGTNIHVKPHKKKGFLGSLMSLGTSKPRKKNKYYGSYPSPYGLNHGGGIGHGGNSFLGKHGSSPAMYTIFPYMAAKKAHKIHRPSFGSMPLFISRPHYHHYHHYRHHGFDGDINPEHSSYFDVYNDNYVGKCQKPIKKKDSKVDCKATFDELKCTAECEEGYKFPNDTKSITNKCWHISGVWKPTKNFPGCLPVCNNECLNGGECSAPEVCKCKPEYRGSRCQFHFLKCNILGLIKEDNLGWSCQHHKNETVCHVRCKDSAEFDFSPAFEYRCTPDGVWKPDTLPHCDKDKTLNV